MTNTLVRTYRSPMPTSAEEVFAWHERPGAFDRLIPSWERIRLIAGDNTLVDGATKELQIRKGPIRLRWVARHFGYEHGHVFRDEQVRGPFAEWSHAHRFLPTGNGCSVLEDEITYRLPFGPVGRWLVGRSSGRAIDRLFAHRHRQTANDLSRHHRFAGRSALRIAVSGSTGLVGTSLCAFLSSGGHSVQRLVRHAPHATSADVAWHPDQRIIESSSLEAIDAVVHLAGENIAIGRWTPSKKAAILRSRVEGTRFLCESLARLEIRPRVLVCASATGFYGDRGDEPLDETSPAGSGFLAQVCREWESATQPAREAGIRVVNFRFGMILSARGGALPRLLTPFRLGLGGRLGDGRQFMGWIAHDDAIGAIHHAIFTDELQGPVNVVAPNAVTNREFTKTLGRVLGRPTVLPVPRIMVLTAFGQMGREVLLASTRVRPRRLEESSFPFLYPTLPEALHAELGVHCSVPPS